MPVCAEDIKDKAIVCIHCGRELMESMVSSPPIKDSKIRIWFLLAILVVACLVAFVDGVTDTKAATWSFTIPQVFSAPTVTKGHLDIVQEGMGYEQVRGMIGSPGEMLSSNELSGIKTVMYSWTNSNGTNMNAIFKTASLCRKRSSDCVEFPLIQGSSCGIRARLLPSLASPSSRIAMF